MDEGNEEEDESLEADAMIKVTTLFYDKRLHIEMLWIRIRGFSSRSGVHDSDPDSVSG
jgi:hypothetical protein